MREKELIKNTLIIFLAKLCTQLISFLMLPLYTSVLSTEEYGFVDIVTTYTALAAPLIGFQLEMGIFRYLIDNRRNDKNKTILITNTIVTIVTSTIFFSILFIIISKTASLPHLWLILSSTITILFSGYFLQVARGLGDNIGYSIASIITGTITVALNI